MAVNLIAAVNKADLGIGFKGTMPWHLPQELKYFKKVTLDSDVIMGMRTFESLLKKPLKNRHNIVLTNSRYRAYDDNLTILHNVTSTEEVLAQALHKDQWIIGGGVVYNMFYNIVEEMHLSVLNTDYKCDTFFPRSWYNIYKLFDKISEEPYDGFTVFKFKRKPDDNKTRRFSKTIP